MKGANNILLFIFTRIIHRCGEFVAILMSIKPKYSRLIFSGVKKYELRKTPIKARGNEVVVVYESTPTKAVVGYFETKKIVKNSPEAIWTTLKSDIGVSEKEFFEYFYQKRWGYALKIDNPKLFDRKISLQELREVYGHWNPPQNFQYLKEGLENKLFLKIA